jgi:hypothetical protein
VDLFSHGPTFLQQIFTVVDLIWNVTRIQAKKLTYTFSLNTLFKFFRQFSFFLQNLVIFSVQFRKSRLQNFAEISRNTKLIFTAKFCFAKFRIHPSSISDFTRVVMIFHDIFAKFREMVST